MKIILLSGGSGKRLWPLSNDARSKQLLKVLCAPGGEKESMIQRIVRQIRETGLTDEIVVAIGAKQRDAIELQLGDEITIVAEPSSRHTFPAIALACSYLAEQGTPDDEPIIVVPSDTFTDNSYFQSIREMADAVTHRVADLVLMGIEPTYPSTRYGYILPAEHSGSDPVAVKNFIEKPSAEVAERLIAAGALWNGGVFAFRLGYLMDILQRMMPGVDYRTLRANYEAMPKSSFDYAVVEKSESIAAVVYRGRWKDIGTWNSLTEELSERVHGNVKSEACDDTYIINELEIPLVCLGGKNMVVAASPDGILVTERGLSENLKHLVDGLGKRPMYETRRWGEYKVIDSVEYPDGYCALTKRLTLQPGKNISYQRHNCRTEVWTFLSGQGEIVLNGRRSPVNRGDVFTIPKGMLHGLRAITPLTFIEVQSGTNLVEEDIERFDFEW